PRACQKGEETMEDGVQACRMQQEGGCGQRLGRLTWRERQSGPPLTFESYLGNPSKGWAVVKAKAPGSVVNLRRRKDLKLLFFLFPRCCGFQFAMRQTRKPSAEVLRPIRARFSGAAKDLEDQPVRRKT